LNIDGKKSENVLFCHSREGGNPVFASSSGLPPEFTPAKAEAGVTIRETFYESIIIER
jgi:hypothetical protein